MTEQPNNPLHGVTLAVIVERLVADLGWETLASEVPAPCFVSAPTIASSLKYLRRHPDERAQVEALYLRTIARTDSGR